MNPPEPLRCFIAIEIPVETKRRISEVTAKFRQNGIRASWVRETGMHLTLRFLGDVAATQRQVIGDELTKIAANATPFNLEATGGGAFPNAKRPRVIWIGVAGGLKNLMTLANKVETAAQRAGLDPVRGTYKPHITIGRLRNPSAATNLQSSLLEHAEFRGGAIPVNRVSLFSSELRPGGARHTLLRAFDLGTHE